MRKSGPALLIKIAGGVAVVGGSFALALWAMDLLSPRTAVENRPALTELPPLQPVTRTSVVIAPVAVALTAIRDAVERQAPKDFSGKQEGSFADVLTNAVIGWTATRGPFAVAGRPDGLALTTNLTGTLSVTGKLAVTAGSGLGGAIGGLLGGDAAKQVEVLIGRVVDQRADVRGGITLRAKPTVTAGWRLEPNLSGQVNVADTAVTLAGIKLNVPNEVKPLLDNTINDQIAALQTRLRADPFMEVAARREWTKMCRSISLKAASPSAPDLWLEIRPTRAVAAQPRVDATDVTLLIGVQSETRITPSETKPNCPFPAQLDLVPPMDNGRISIAVPVDVPFTELNKLVEAQLKGRKFPEDGSGSVEVTVKSAALAASGDRILISLRVNAREKKSWFGFGADATVHVWGKPVLDQAKQILRLTDIALDVQSEAAFGLLGAAARAAMPYLQDALAANAVIDLKPFAAGTRQSIQASLADFRQSAPGMRVDADITDLRLAGIAFDSKTLRVIAEANGAAKVTVSQLP